MKCSGLGHTSEQCQLPKGVCHYCGSEDHYRNNCPDLKKRAYALQRNKSKKTGNDL